MRDISPEEFIRVYQRASSAVQVARALGVSVGAVTSRADLMRTKGIPLKRMPASKRIPWDVPSLVELAEKALQPDEVDIDKAVSEALAEEVTEPEVELNSQTEVRELAAGLLEELNPPIPERVDG